MSLDLPGLIYVVAREHTCIDTLTHTHVLRPLRRHEDHTCRQAETQQHVHKKPPKQFTYNQNSNSTYKHTPPLLVWHLAWMQWKKADLTCAVIYRVIFQTDHLTSHHAR